MMGKRLRRGFLTTHSESIVRQLNTAELYLVSKVDGKTKVSPAELAGVDDSAGYRLAGQFI